jgi:hypothetical protein
MKTTKNIFKFILTALAVVTFFSCDIPVSLGSKLDLEGPVVTITSPSQRTSVPTEFYISGTVQDFTGIDRLEIKVLYSNRLYEKQWRYYKGQWEVSENSGATWNKYDDAVWNGSNTSASWKIHINMEITGRPKPTDGEYTFNIQAWDKGDFSDDKSFKALVLIVDNDPPKVDVSYPFIYRGASPYTDDPEFSVLHGYGDASGKWKEPSNLGKFFAEEFTLKWQIDDYNDIASFDLRLYEYDVVVDSDPETPLPDNYIYRYTQTLGVPPYVEANGEVIVPNLDIAPGIYDKGGEIKNSITGKTTIKVATVCYDVAGNAAQEKAIGYFIYWPIANTPWIDFSEGMGNAPAYGSSTASGSTVENDVYKVYPGKTIKATAYQTQGVKEVKYTLYKCDTIGDKFNHTNNNYTEIINSQEGIRQENIEIKNTPTKNGIYSTIFSWEFTVANYTGYYIIKAEAFSTKGKSSETYYKLFLVTDISYPDFSLGPFPKAGDPLFLAIGKTTPPDGTPGVTGTANTITIAGLVSDSTGISSLCLVWIDPESVDYAAMSQLAYFRDPGYKGWTQAISMTPGANALETSPYDPNHRNRLWRLALSANTPARDPITDRLLFKYSQTINLNDLNIGTGKQNLKSQTFLLRVENTSGKTTIITYAPQGDTLAPEIKIDEVIVRATSGGSIVATAKPGEYSVIPKFADGNTITINGSWKEDSTENLDIATYFKPNFEVAVNPRDIDDKLSNSAITITKTSGKAAEGTWTITTTVRSTPTTGQVPLTQLKDTLTIDVKAKDIGGNVAEIGSSWLIQSDNLRLMRISSELADGVYSIAKGKVEIFLEFSKPVSLATGVSQKPQLILTSATGNTARAIYKDNQNDQNSRQYFEYTIAAGENTTTPEFLNVKGLYYNGTEYTTGNNYNVANYPFKWTRGAGGEYEEVRLTMINNANTTGNVKITDGTGTYYARTLPTANTGDQFTLISGKNLKIDTTAPTIKSIKADSAAGWYNSGSIYFTIEFSEDVIVATTPQFPLNIGTSTTNWTSATAADVRVNGNKISFIYTIKGTETSNGNEIYVSSGNNYTGSITDLAGNVLAANAVASLGAPANRTLTGVYIETQLPSAPSLRLLSASNTNNVVEQKVNDSTQRGEIISTSLGAKTLSNIYNENLWLAIEGSGNAYKYNAIEYSIDDGLNWVRAPNTANTPFQLTQTGAYKLVARQIDSAGNQSTKSNAINFNWDKGALLTRISSESANGVYTHVLGRNEIKLTLFFRKSLFITNSATLTLNATNGSNAAITVKNTAATTGTSVTFTYTVANGDKTPASTDLAITAMNNIVATDGTSATNGVDVSTLIANNFASLATPKLDATKQFTVETGNLTNTAPTFAADSGTEGNDNFHGISSVDGSYWTTLQIKFNHTIFKGSGFINIQQIAGTGTTAYRLPAVMTEAQYNRFKSIANFGDYYSKGTNGYDNSAGTSDTTTRYILQYKWNPNSSVTANNSGFTGDAFIPSAFFNLFREAEKITIPVNAQTVSISGDTLSIRLTGSNAPQVPGASYEVTFDPGIVSDSLGNSSTTGSYTGANAIALRGVAKPFIRVRKNQDTIAVTNAASTSRPRLEATQPFQARARMDCRTPNSSISYTRTEYKNSNNADVTGGTSRTTLYNNWGTGMPGGEGAANGQPTSTLNGPNDTANGATRPGTPATAFNSGELTLGTNNEYQGYQWWARARATATVGGTAYTSAETEEKAYKTVITLQVRNNRENDNRITFNDNEQNMGSGDQVWIRGGDAIGSSSIPGFPFTWEDNWNGTWKNKRAGIRLMTKTNTTDNLNASEWKFISWEINATAYVDFIMGRDTASSADQAWQFGPTQTAYARSGWTSFKDKYPVFPGKHRWCDMGGDWAGKYAMNFSATFHNRPTDLVVDYTNVNTQ